MIDAAIGEPVDQPGITMEGEDHRLVPGEQLIEVHVAQAVWVLDLRLQFHQVDNIHHADLQRGQVFAQDGNDCDTDS